MNDSASLYEQQFNTQFEIVSANTPELVTECKKLRYQIFCEERNVFDGNNFLEEDHYDEQSLQTLLRDKISGKYIATARLILSRGHEGEFSYPLEECATKQNHKALDMINKLSKEQTAEVSRFSVSKELRKHSPSGISSTRGNTVVSAKDFHTFVTVGLIKGIIKISAENNVQNWLALMKPSFLRLLSRIGVNFNVLESHINYCDGKRYACKNTVAGILEGIKQTKPEAWRLITDNGQITIH